MSLSSTPASVNPSFVPAHPLAQGAQRYPLPVLAHGYTPAPNLVRQAWPALGATYAAYFLYETIISYQRSAAPPAIYVAQLAADLRIDPRRIRALTAQLVGLGLLAVGRALDGRNLYDFRPLYAHVEAWAQPTADARTAAPPSRPADTKAALSVRANGRKPAAYEEGNNSRLDSRPPTPYDERGKEPDDADPDRQAVAAAVAALGAELDDVAPRSSTTRALRAFEISGLTAAVFMQLAHEADRITQRRRRKAPPIARPMAYWFDVLRILLDDQAAQDTPPASSPPARRPRRSDASLLRPSPAPAAVVPAPPADAWGQVRAEIAQEVTPENYARWFLPTRQLDQAGDVLTVAITGAETPALHQQWLDRRLRSLIERCAARVRPGLQVRFVVEALAPPLDQAL